MNQFYGAYVFMFFPCSNPLSYKLTGHGFESSAAINQTYFLQGSNKYSINLQGSGSVKQLVVESAMIDADSAFSLKMEMVLRNNTEITLIPESQLTLPPCLHPLPSNAPYGTTTASNAFNTDQDQIVRVNTTRACSQDVVGTCRNKEICITNDIILNNNNTKAAFCYCFDNFQLDGQYRCTQPVPQKKNGISIPAIVSGAVVTAIILVVVVVLVAKHVIKRGPRDLGFNPLNDSSVVLEDPPMINV
ncbi:hypothetical protein HELRODRAFT_173715 [Helobdella robusta]|uniref:Uncharacterized protein n=1 Tax=Helobdella robusta TaxID=6412 RepID=T1F756_HELRO|nr:hypothetical protein HELRODRAFT_173715 [Helobdella robusta]ESO03419.1 hypothetical protein HELRODRAFT_173715 [Helobdella robusta]